MLFSKMFIPTVKEDPKEAEVISHRLMLRGGFIRRLSSGIYTWLPLGLKALRKVERIIREEMNNKGAQEILMPGVQPKELWVESTRWEKYGKELLRFVDRNDRELCLGPTHEEVVTDLVRREVRSYRELPVTLYQIHAACPFLSAIEIFRIAGLWPPMSPRARTTRSTTLTPTTPRCRTRPSCGTFSIIRSRGM